MEESRSCAEFEESVMGIVMAVFMLLGLLLVSPWKRSTLLGRPSVVRAASVGLMIAGMWNALWYGLRHLNDFWGLAALISGILMVAVAIIALAERGTAGSSSSGFVIRAYKMVKPLSLPIIVGLLACFLLYSITLVRLNLGYSIIGY